MHLLLFLPAATREAFTDPGHIDSHISAEIPLLEDDPTGVLTAVVRKYMLHGPCGEHNPTAPCMVQRPGGQFPVCSKRFPKPYCPETIVREDGYPEYRRRNNGRTLEVRVRGRSVRLDNC